MKALAVTPVRHTVAEQDQRCFCLVPFLLFHVDGESDLNISILKALGIFYIVAVIVFVVRALRLILFLLETNSCIYCAAFPYLLWKEGS